MDLLKSKDASANKVAKVIAMDPILTATLIKYADSPLYRRRCKLARPAKRILGRGARYDVGICGKTY